MKEVEMDWSYSTHGRNEKFVENLCRKTWKEETTRNT